MRVAHQDRAIEDLNSTITAQWKEIENLNRQIERVAIRCRSSRPGVPNRASAAGGSEAAWSARALKFNPEAHQDRPRINGRE